MAKNISRSFVLLLATAIVTSCGVQSLPTPDNIEPTSTITSSPVPTITATPTPRPIPLVVNGEPLRFIGANSVLTGHFRLDSQNTEDVIRTAKENNITVLRIYVDRLGLTGGDYYQLTQIDNILDIAAKHEVYLIVTLADCSGEPDYAFSPYCLITDPVNVAAFKERISEILGRKNTINGKIYKEDPIILAWDIANEIQIQQFSDAEIHTWLVEMSSYVRSLNPSQLITVGWDLRWEKYDVAGVAYESLDAPDLDFFSFHYNLVFYQGAMPEHLELIQFRINALLSMGKPVVLEEFGIGSQQEWGEMNQATLDRWVKAYKDQLDAAFSAGAAGAMFWGWEMPEEIMFEELSKLVYAEGMRHHEIEEIERWIVGDHDISEIGFTKMIREYQIPPYE